jgi:acetyl esterase/lipase
MRDRIPSTANEFPRVGHFVFAGRGSLHTRPPILKWFHADSPQGRIAVPNTILLRSLAFLLTFLPAWTAQAEHVRREILCAEPVNERQTLDVYAPDDAKNLPVVFWIHVGGWEVGEVGRSGIPNG